MHRLLASTLLPFCILAGEAIAQTAIPQDLLDLRSITSSRSTAATERQAACRRLMPQANQRLPSADGWRLRAGIECANVDLELGEAANALAQHEALLADIRSARVEPVLELAAMRAKAMAFSALGRPAESVRELEAATELAHRRYGRMTPPAQVIAATLCGAYSASSRHDEAIALCSEIVGLRKSRSPGDITTASALHYWGNSLVYRNASPADIRRGVELLEASVRDIELGAGKNSLSGLQIRRDLAYALQRDRQRERAEQEARAVRQEFARQYGEKHPETVTTDALLAILLSEQNRNAEAAALQGNRPGDAAPPDKTRLSRDLLRAINLVGAMRNKEALEALDAWAADAERLRDQLTLDPVAKAQFTQSWRNGYQMQALVYFRMGQHRSALASVELAKARTLMSSMEDMDAMRALPDAERAAAQKVMRDASLERQRQRLAQPGSPVALQASRLATEHEAAFAQILERGASTHVKTRVTRSHVEQEILNFLAQAKDDEAYLSLGYGLGNTQGIMPMLIRKGRVHVPLYALTTQRNADSTITAMRMLAQHGTRGLEKLGLKVVSRQPEGFALVPASTPEPAITEPRKVVEYLSDKILGPFTSQLQGVTRLIVSPDGPTWLIPFDLLETGGQPVFRTMKVSYTPSLSVLSIQRRRMQESRATPASAPDAPDPAPRRHAVEFGQHQRQLGQRCGQVRVPEPAQVRCCDTAGSTRLQQATAHRFGLARVALERQDLDAIGGLSLQGMQYGRRVVAGAIVDETESQLWQCLHRVEERRRRET